MKIADSKPVEVTVIMPVYNVQDYIDRSIKSFLAQTLANFELLLVDDGSTDDSGKICDEYAESDSRIKVFHKPNGGVASARALGLEKATGKYIIHSDPDDWVEPEMLSEMFTLAERNHSDIVFADYYRNYTNNKQVYFSVSPAKDPLVCISHTLLNCTHNSLCDKLVKREFIETNNIRFIPNINHAEDSLFVIKLLLHNPAVAYINKAYYHYCFRDGSITATNSRENLFNHFNQIKETEKLLFGYDFNKELQHMKLVFKIRLIIAIGTYGKQEYKTFFPVKWHLVLANSTLRIDHKIQLILAEFGFLKTAFYIAEIKKIIKKYCF